MPSQHTEAVLAREGHVGQHIGLALVHQGGQFRPAGVELVGDVPPDLHSAFLVGLVEGLPDRNGNDGVLALGHMLLGDAGTMVVDQDFQSLRFVAQGNLDPFAIALCILQEVAQRPPDRRPTQGQSDLIGADNGNLRPRFHQLGRQFGQEQRQIDRLSGLMGRLSDVNVAPANP